MKIVVNSKEFDSGKMVRSKYKVYSKVRDELTGKENYDDEDLDKMVNALVVLFDNQFTEDDINDEFEVSDIILIL
ncbi:putative gp12 protein [[Clostridium] sordellii ATCC 9714]|nr:putative gp12 protein [[Clostridium] sordellii ATCC 9714] [Paeniclostridium sordellii ATCC 9714]